MENGRVKTKKHATRALVVPTNLELFHLLLLHVNNSKTSVEAKTKKRHDKNLEKLRYGQSRNQSEQICCNQHIKQKWVQNLSSKSLTHTQTGVLEKGFNFALSPKSLPMVDIICGVEEGLRKVNDAATVSTALPKVAEVLQIARPGVPKPGRDWGGCIPPNNLNVFPPIF